MIVNHQYKFIFLANRKTASTSVAIALSAHCGEDDIITPLRRVDELIRTDRGGLGPRNYIPMRNKLRHACMLTALRTTGINLRKQITACGYHTHITAEDARKLMPKKIWETYYKFCFVRNPWDRVISQYYWVARDRSKEIALNDFIESDAIEIMAKKSASMYMIQNQLAVEKICKYEDLHQELSLIYCHLGIKDEPKLPMAKSDYRQERRHYSETLTSSQIQRIRVVFAEEIELAGYLE
jgi:hypothetical protein